MLAVEAGEKGKGKEKGKKGKEKKGKKKGKCFICGSEDHWKKDCPQKKKEGGKTGGESKECQSGSSVNTVTKEETEDESLAVEICKVSEPSLWTQTEIFDSGSSRHISPYRHIFTSFEPIKPCPLRAANHQSFHAVGKGDITIDVPNGQNQMSSIHLKNILYSPDAGYMLVSIGRLDNDGYSTTFSKGRCVIHGHTGEQIAEIPRSERGLYKFVKEVGEQVNAVDETCTLEEVHRQLGHISLSTIQHLSSNNLIAGIAIPSIEGKTSIPCDSCVYGKVTRIPIVKLHESGHAQHIGNEIHTDVWGPARTVTKKGQRYYVTFTDDYSRWTHIEFLRQKSEVFEAYKCFEAWLETQFGARIKVLNLIEEENIHQQSSKTTSSLEAL